MSKHFIIENERQTNRIGLKILWILVFLQFPVAYLMDLFFNVFYFSPVHFLLAGLVSAVVTLIPTLLQKNNRFFSLVKYFNILGTFAILAGLHFITGNDLTLQTAWVGTVAFSCLYFKPGLTLLAGMGAFIFEIFFGFIYPLSVKLPPNL